MSGGMEQTEYVLLCEDSQEGVFTGVYEAYARKLNVRKVRLVAGEEENIRLFAEYIPVETDAEKSVKAARTIRCLAGEESYERLCLTLSSTAEDKAQAVFQTIVLMLQNKKRAPEILNRLTDTYVHRVFELSRKTGNEMHRLREFLRFQELQNRVLYAKIAPENDVLVYLMPHFSDRFPMENFLIYDEGRRLLGVHPSQGEWYLMRDIMLEQELLTYSQEEEQYCELFRYFCKKVEIPERKNVKLQRNLLPLKFRKYMVEF